MSSEFLYQRIKRKRHLVTSDKFEEIQNAMGDPGKVPIDIGYLESFAHSWAGFLWLPLIISVANKLTEAANPTDHPQV